MRHGIVRAPNRTTARGGEGGHGLPHAQRGVLDHAILGVDRRAEVLVGSPPREAAAGCQHRRAHRTGAE
eukprot:11205915-Heterocapsa_arctica.AAC.1